MVKTYASESLRTQLWSTRMPQNHSGLSYGLRMSQYYTTPLVGDGVERPFRLLVNQVLTLCSVMPSVSPSGPLMGEPLFMVSSASLQSLASSTLCSLVGKWFWVCVERGERREREEKGGGGERGRERERERGREREAREKERDRQRDRE